MDQTIEQMKNLGATSRLWLQAAGIHTKSELESIGAVQAYIQVKALGFPASLNLLYAMEAALLDIHWTKLSAAHKEKLKLRIKQTTLSQL